MLDETNLEENSQLKEHVDIFPLIMSLSETLNFYKPNEEKSELKQKLPLEVKSVNADGLETLYCSNCDVTIIQILAPPKGADVKKTEKSDSIETTKVTPTIISSTAIIPTKTTLAPTSAQTITTTPIFLESSSKSTDQQNTETTTKKPSDPFVRYSMDENFIQPDALVITESKDGPIPPIQQELRKMIREKCKDNGCATENSVAKPAFEVVEN